MTTITEHAYQPRSWANPEVLTWARRRMGLDHDRVEGLTKIPKEHLIAWERDEAAPTLADLELLADIYRCPVGYFFLQSPPDVRLPLDFRGLVAEKTDTISYETNLALQEFTRLVEYAANLIETLGLPWELGLGEASLDEPIDHAAQREGRRLGSTSQIRQKWQSSEDAFAFWKGAIENQGVLVVSLKLNPHEVRGASQWVPPQPPAILVNRADAEATTGRIFTLIHEWVHLLVKRPGLVCDFRGHEDHSRLERFANMFAAEVLVPRNDLKSFLKAEGLFEYHSRWGDPTLDNIKHHFKVSRDVIAILIEELELAPPGFYRNKRASWDERRPFFAFHGHSGTRKGVTQAERRLTELGLPLSRMLATGYSRGAISRLDLADLLNMRIEKAERFVEWVQQEKQSPQT